MATRYKPKGFIHQLTGINFGKAFNNVFAGISILLAKLFMKTLHIIGIISINLTGNYIQEKKYIPPIGNRPILRESLTKITDKIRRKQITAEEVVQTYIQRTYEVNRQLNAIVCHRFTLALEEARRADKLIQSGNFSEEELRVKFPLLGIPFTIKDFYHVQGLKNTAGIYGRKDIIATDDADVIKALRQAGAIPFGVTNVSELCMWWEAVNPIYGRSSNPYDTRRSPGGSSGGEAALQCVAGAGFGVGSDLGGSVRLPAFFCGVYGHKPTRGLVSNDGHDPPTSGTIADYLCTGPIVRHAEDLEIVLKAMAGSNCNKLLKTPELKKVRLFYMEHDGGSPLNRRITKEMRQALLKSIHYLETKLQLKATKLNLRKMYHSAEIWGHGISNASVPTICEELALRRGKINPFMELFKMLFNRSRHSFPVIVIGIVEKLAYFANKTWSRPKKMIKLGEDLNKELEEILGEDGILLYPVHPSTAPKHFEPMFHPGDFSYCAIFNVLGNPATQVPLGLGSRGLPLGVQVVGGKFCDLTTIKIAQLLEAGFSGWIPPCSNNIPTKRIKFHRAE